jgi:putative DNA methylase
MSFRGIAMVWNWGDTNVLYEKGNSYSITKSVNSISRGLEYLTSALLTNKTNNSSNIKIFQGDATSLNLNEKFDIIVTDPPYADDVAYTELSDFYYVWLKEKNSDNISKR